MGRYAHHHTVPALGFVNRAVIVELKSDDGYFYRFELFVGSFVL